MANYCCTVRTNYFHVKDPVAFRSGMAHVQGSEDSVELWEEKDGDGNPIFGFGCYGGLFGKVLDEDDEAYDEDEDYDVTYYRLIDFLKESVADDDAVLIMEAGNEKMRYVVGSVLVITSAAVRYGDIQQMGVEIARDLLGDSNWGTQTEY